MYNIKIVIYLIVLIGTSIARGGSYEDFFLAIDRDDAVSLQQLLQRGFDPNTPGPDGVPGLVLAIRSPSPKVTELLVGWPSTRIDVRTEQDESPLMLAALRGMTPVCSQLIARDADVNKPGWTPLHYAAAGGNADVVALLLEHHAYIDAESPNGSTPLMMAAMYGTLAVVRLLLQSGADAGLRNSLGHSALDFALQADKGDSVALLRALSLGDATPRKP